MWKFHHGTRTRRICLSPLLNRVASEGFTCDLALFLGMERFAVSKRRSTSLLRTWLECSLLDFELHQKVPRPVRSAKINFT